MAGARLKVLKVLEGCQLSLERLGMPVNLNELTNGVN